MATFIIPAHAFTSVQAAGSSAPKTGYYSATITAVEDGQKNSFSRRVSLTLEGGYTTRTFLNTPYNADNPPTIYPGITKEKADAMIAFTKAIFESAGYTNKQVEDAGGVSDDWLVNNTVYVEFHNAKDIGSKYHQVVGFMKQAQYDSLIANGSKPAVATSTQVANAPAAPMNASAPQTVVAAATPAPAPAAATPAPLPAAPNNGVGVGGVALPPAPMMSNAQNIIS